MEQYAGITITVTDDIGAFEDWMDDGSGIHGINLAATMERYAETYARALEEQYPGARVDFRWSNGGGRTTITGRMDEANDIDDESLALAQQLAFDRICPDGNPDQIIVWEEE